MKLLSTLALALLATAASAQESAPQATPTSIVAGAPVSDWRAIDPANLLVMTLAPDSSGKPRQVVIQLVPAPFSEGWVGNIRTLAGQHWWDGTTVYRVVDNWVSQWGDGEDDKPDAKPLPEGLKVIPESEYTAPMTCEVYKYDGKVLDERCAPAFAAIEAIDPYVMQGQTGFSGGWPVAFMLTPEGNRIWPTHCYGTVGVARDLSPDTGTGAELYAVIGHAPRALDRNIAVVGRVIEGIEHLSTLPRGKGEAGVYDDPALKVPIVSVRLGNDMPEADRPHFEFLASDSASFAQLMKVRANRSDEFYKVPAGGVDVCNVPVPMRRAASR
ncbi:peptidylprolyl isomerase [Croceibacterium sp. LX-88]|uniref:Peptidylprolyl isomerase n=1 Tax=Croceibacterium selenioxidans TaxID=2838833 RepID=A0ABS5W7R6_9SPHN|nr:peptidylprolyl isomerase [Croceibacterium selenioxidans]MBT2135790.1 peptidylprolyl isomerase [Croceibacterium selenioxidans]